MFCYVQASNWSNMSRFQEIQVMICPACSTCFGSTANSLAFHFFVTAHAGSQVLGCWGFSQVCIFRLIASHELSPVLQSPQLKIEFGCATNILSINIIYIYLQTYMMCSTKPKIVKKTTKRKMIEKMQKKNAPISLPVSRRCFAHICFLTEQSRPGRLRVCELSRLSWAFKHLKHLNLINVGLKDLKSKFGTLEEIFKLFPMREFGRISSKKHGHSRTIVLSLFSLNTGSEWLQKSFEQWEQERKRIALALTRSYYLRSQ